MAKQLATTAQSNRVNHVSGGEKNIIQIIATACWIVKGMKQMLDKSVQKKSRIIINRI